MSIENENGNFAKPMLADVFLLREWMPFFRPRNIYIPTLLYGLLFGK